MDERLDADKPAHPAAAWQVDVVGGFQVITEALLVQLGAEPVGRHRTAGVVVAPDLVDFIEALGADLSVGFEAEVTLRFQKIQDIVVAAFDGVQIAGSAGADRKLVVISQKPRQSFQAPEKDAFQFLTELFDQKRVVLPAGWTFFCGQDKLPPPEAVRVVIQRSQRAVAEAEEAGIKIALIALESPLVT